MHHHGGIPAEQRTVATLDFLVARELRFLVHGDGVDVVRGGHGRDLDALGTCSLEEASNDELCTFRALGLDQGIECLDPFRRLFVVLIRQAQGEGAEDVVIRL